MLHIVSSERTSRLPACLIYLLYKSDTHIFVTTVGLAQVFKTGWSEESPLGTNFLDIDIFVNVVAAVA